MALAPNTSLLIDLWRQIEKFYGIDWSISLYFNNDGDQVLKFIKIFIDLKRVGRLTKTLNLSWQLLLRRKNTRMKPIF